MEMDKRAMEHMMTNCKNKIEQLQTTFGIVKVDKV